jgi:hypothetical protein
MHCVVIGTLILISTITHSSSSSIKNESTKQSSILSYLFDSFLSNLDDDNSVIVNDNHHLPIECYRRVPISIHNRGVPTLFYTYVPETNECEMVFAANVWPGTANVFNSFMV